MAEASGEPPRPPRPRLWCDHCRMPGHTIQTCIAVTRITEYMRRCARQGLQKRAPGVKKTRRGTRAGKARKERSGQQAKEATAKTPAAKTDAAPALPAPNTANAVPASGVQGTGAFMVPEGLTPAELAPLWNTFVAQVMSDRSAGTTSQGDGRSQEPEQGHSDVGTDKKEQKQKKGKGMTLGRHQVEKPPPQ